MFHHNIHCSGLFVELLLSCLLYTSYTVLSNNYVVLLFLIYKRLCWYITTNQFLFVNNSEFVQMPILYKNNWKRNRVQKSSVTSTRLEIVSEASIANFMEGIWLYTRLAAGNKLHPLGIFSFATMFLKYWLSYLFLLTNYVCYCFIKNLRHLRHLPQYIKTDFRNYT